MVHLQRPLVAVAGQRARTHDAAGVVREDIDSRKMVVKLAPQRSNVIESREVGDEERTVELIGDGPRLVWRGPSPMTTWCPSAFARRAAAAPIPSLAPVMTITLSFMNPRDGVSASMGASSWLRKSRSSLTFTQEARHRRAMPAARSW